MPTLEHNALVEMFRENPELAPHFLALLFQVDVPPHTSVVVVESSLDQLIPVEFRADLVLELRDAKGALVLAIVLEVQREKDPDKEYSWPVYVAVLRAKKRCPTVVLVVAPDADVAAWAAQPIDRPGARGGVLSDHLERVARAHAAGCGGDGYGTAGRRRGNISPVRTADRRSGSSRG